MINNNQNVQKDISSLSKQMHQFFKTNVNEQKNTNYLL